MIYYVDCNADGNGTKENPFKTISQAAAIAVAGDEIIVKDGIYREEVSPVNAGIESAPIVYRAENSRGAKITGADIFKGWEKVEGDVWKLTVSDEYFGSYNPYKTMLSGDWLDIVTFGHTGEVFLNGKALYEKKTLEEVKNPVIYEGSWDKEFTKHTWYTCEEPGQTIIYANFQGKDPNEECVELTVRRHCFYPEKEHVNYIAVKGFVISKAATQWAPPTALQEGMIGPHWSKGWLIEDCEVSDSKCSGISLGKYYQEGNDNKWSLQKYKDGTQTQRDCALIAQLDGWSKETIGSHIVRGCDIHDCGQTGIVGNLGCVFSIIENCEIHNINNKRDIGGAEIGGIKFHGAIDVIIRNNRIHHCTRGVWLDWQCQGSRISSNLFHDNCMPYDYLLKKEHKPGMGMGEDLFIEIAHGPTLVDNNILLSDRAIRLASQGCAFVHNLIYGSLTAVGRGVKNGTNTLDSTRYTPIHRPHSTGITGFMSVLNGDVRFYNNVFVQPEIRQGLADICEGDQWDDETLVCGTVSYSDYMTEAEWKACFEGNHLQGSDFNRDLYYIPLPVWTGGNVFFNGAQPSKKEEDFTVDTEHKVSVKLSFQETDEETNCVLGSWTLESDFEEFLPEAKLIDTETLGMAFEPEERFEGPNGEDIIFDTDIFGNKRERIVAGPFAIHVE